MSTTGIKGRFFDRLKKIVFFKRKKMKLLNKDKSVNINKPNIINNDNIKFEDSKDIYNNYIKVVSAIPLIVYENIISNDLHENENNRLNDNIKNSDMSIKNIESNTNKVKNNDNNKINNELLHNISKEENIILNKKNVKNEILKKEERHKNIEIIKNIDVDNIKKKQDIFNNYKGIDKYNIKNKEEIDYVKKRDIIEEDNKIKTLEKSIINLIKKDLVKIVNEMEILQSELYILSEVNGDNKVLKECQKELDNVKSIICKIDKLKEQYDFLRDNYDFEYLLEIDNHDLVDKIIELRDTFGNNELKAVASDYKLLDAYKYLYLKLDDLQDKTVKFEEKKKEEELKLKERDIDFNKLKEDVYNLDYSNNNYDGFIKEQNRILDEIDNNVSKINSYEQVDYHLKGFNELFKNSFKYFGLLMVSPLKGVLPAIATETLITGNLIKNLYKNLEWEESKKMVYEAIDYSSKINNAISDLDNTCKIVDMTLDDIVKLKMRYNDKFKMYQGDFLEYRDVMHKLNDMENKILGNKIKIEMMKKKTLEQQMINQKKLILVKELNKN